MDADEKPLKPSKSTLPSSFNVVSKKVDDLVDEDNDSEVEEVYNETATYMVSTGFNVNKASKGKTGRGNKSLYELWKVICMDITNNTRKWSKIGQTRTRERKECKRAGKLLSMGKLKLRTWLNNSSDKVQAGRVRRHERLSLVEAHKKGHADI
ncbi:hypothetical protein Tco_0615009 [Tanacetum coccineum]